MNGLDRSLLIQVEHHEYGSARCSGFQFDNVAIADGTFLHILCSNSCDIDDSKAYLDNFRLAVKELSKQQYFQNQGDHKKEETFSFKILRENVSVLNTIKASVPCSEYVEKEKPVGELYSFEDARLCFLYKYDGGFLWDILNFRFINEQNKNYYNYDTFPIPFFFLMTGQPTKHLFFKTLHNLMAILNGIQIYPGLSIAVESTPFADLVFYNSLSRGIVSKTLGTNQEWFLIDARVVMACGGAPIYVFEDDFKGTAIGIVVAIVPRSNEEILGFSVGLSLKHLCKAALGLKTIDYIPFNKPKLPQPPSLLNIEQLSSAVIFVRCQHKWGSGVVVHADLGLILTCSHIVYHGQDSVYVIFQGKKYRTNVVYATPPSHPFDLALLSVGKIPGLKQLVLSKNSPVLGESVFTVGYALSMESSVVANGTPTLSGGCVSKLSHGGGPLQTTCCTHSGVSGGAVIRPPDQLIGIVVCNIRVNTSVLPCFGFAVSVDDFRTPVSQFIKTNNPAYLQSLTVKSPDVEMKWNLQDSKL